MRFVIPLCAILTVFPPTPLQAQGQEWPEHSDQQLWERASTFSTLGVVTAIRYAKETGASIEEFGRWWGDLFAPTWGEPGAYSPANVMRGMRFNHLSWAGSTVEILSESDDAVTARFSRSWVPHFGDDQTWHEVTVAEFESVFYAFQDAVAERHGLDVRRERDGEFIVVTFARR